MSKIKPPENVIYNFSSNDLTGEEIQALSHGLDQHISSNPDRCEINTDFDYFYQNIFNGIFDLLQHHLDRTKTNSKAANKYKKVIDKSSKNKNIIIIKQDTGLSLAILDRTKHIDKCLSMLATKQSSELDYVIQQVNWKVKCNEH